MSRAILDRVRISWVCASAVLLLGGCVVQDGRVNAGGVWFTLQAAAEEI